MHYQYLCIVCLAIMALFIITEALKKYKVAVVLKGLASSVFVILGLLSIPYCSKANFAGNVLIGLILGCIADILLNLRYVFEKKGQLIFLVGILVFLAGHVMYLVALIPQVKMYYIGLGIGVVLTAFLMSYILRVVTAKLPFKIFGVFYIGAIMMMTCVAWQNVLFNWSNGALLFGVGAIFFLISDIVLILNTFTEKTRFTLRIVNLSLYYVGQLMIAMALQLL